MKRKPPATIKASTKNAKTSFRNCRIHEEGMICARLGLDRDLPSSFECSSPTLSVSALVRKGKRREICQDAAMIFMKDGFLAAAVFDGYGPNGTFLSEKTADLLIELFSGGEMGDILHKACSEIARIPSEGKSHKGGSTATLVSMLSNGDLRLDGISDSSAFRIGKGGAHRYLRYFLDFRDMMVSGQDVRRYFFNQSRVRDTIRISGISPLAIHSEHDTLRPGQSLILVTDGVTKNLTVRIDEDMRVTENSGLGDLLRILRGKIHPDMIPALLEVVDRRISRAENSRGYRRCNKDTVLYPADDDLTIVVITRH